MTSYTRSRRLRSSRSTGQSRSLKSAAPQPAWPQWTTFVSRGCMYSYYLFHAVRADLLRRLGRTTEAAAAYAAARVLTANPVEQAFLDAQRAAIG